PSLVCPPILRTVRPPRGGPTYVDFGNRGAGRCSPRRGRWRPFSGATCVRLRPWHMLVFIIIVTAVAVWIDLPGQTADFAGVKGSVTVHEGLDLQGGVQVLLQAQPAAGQKLDKDVLNGTRDAVERRVNGLGVSEPVIRTRGNNQISVE